MRVIISAGGTGGHIYPALAILNKIATFSYQVMETELLAGSAVEDMSAGEWDLPLFTCNYNGQSRVTVRCLKIQ